MAAWCLEVLCELSAGNQCIGAGHQDKLVRGKAGHSIPLAPSLGTVSSRILSAVLRIRTRRPLSAVPCFVLSVCHPNSFILQTHLVLSPSRTRMGLAIVSSSRPPPRSCLGGGRAVASSTVASFPWGGGS